MINSIIFVLGVFGTFNIRYAIRTFKNGFEYERLLMENFKLKHLNQYYEQLLSDKK